MLGHDGVVPLGEAGVGGLRFAGLNVGPAVRDPFADGVGGKLGAVLGGEGDDLGVGAVGVGEGPKDRHDVFGREGADAVDEAGHEALQ